MVAWWNLLRRWLVKYALAVVGATAVLFGGSLVTCTRVVVGIPGRLTQLDTAVSVLTRRQKGDSARADSSYRVNAGVLSVLCFGLSDKAFAAAQQLCGEAFAVSRIVAGERVQREEKKR